MEISGPSREQVLGQFGNALHTYTEHQAWLERSGMTQEQMRSEIPLLAELQGLLGVHAGWYEPQEGMEPSKGNTILAAHNNDNGAKEFIKSIARFPADSDLHNVTAADLTGHARRVYDNSEEDQRAFPIVAQSLRWLERELKDGDPGWSRYALYHLAIIAALSKPADGIPKKQRSDEQSDDYIYRKAIDLLDRAAKKATPITAVEHARHQQMYRKGDAQGMTAVQILRSPENKELTKVYNASQLQNLAKALGQYVRREDVTQEAMEAEVQYVVDFEVDRNKVILNRYSVPEMLRPTQRDWTFTPKEDIGKAGRPDGEVQDRPSSADALQERYDWLEKLARDWHHPGAGIAETDLVSTGTAQTSRGTQRYRAAILPEDVQINGQTVRIYHAVADGGRPDHAAAYVFRAEQGLNSDGTTWLTWLNVFDGDIDSARQLGARKITHDADFDDKVLEYLTRRPDQLEREGYRLRPRRR